MALTANEKRLLATVLRDYAESADNPDFLAEWTDLTTAQRAAIIAPLVQAVKTRAQGNLATIDAETAAAKVRLNGTIAVCDSLLAKFP